MTLGMGVEVEVEVDGLLLDGCEWVFGRGGIKNELGLVDSCSQGSGRLVGERYRLICCYYPEMDCQEYKNGCGR